MLKKLDILIDIETGDEWKVDAKTAGPATQPAVDNKKPKPLWVYILKNEYGQRRFVYEHMVEKEFTVKGAASQ